MQKKFMQRAIELAREGMDAGAGGPFGSVVVRDGEIIAEGYNGVTSNNDPTAHAEVTAIREACQKLGTFQLEDCEIYTSCEPCPMCLGAIYWARPKAVYYACSREDAAAIDFDDQLIYDEIDAGIENRQIPFKQIQREEALGVFDAWQKKTDKIEY
ncbi:guanine deaminase [Marinicella pacifica]|jgi:tRNA(Arg) A34 adenosine deaminase TadA|uniref:Guanine deaminase n=1 Tax=Marinicella pacifica TaxID=1171543 RepID=A0A917FMF6_9GAMM|nr:nucleoside deaminase [Marinicella pacifica]GGF92631.1 guanine deaminase [Marinicella pacifica]